MRLSVAMMLGSTTCKMVPGKWSSCALGAAANAVGIADNARRPYAIYDQWPWLRYPSPRGHSFGAEIYSRFDADVCRGGMTFEELVDYVRSIEPDELLLEAGEPEVVEVEATV